MAMFILKTEPSEFSFDDLLVAGSTVWDGVSNAQALANLRRASPGDEVLIYETGSRKAIVGVARVESRPCEDPARPGLTADGLPKAPMVEIRAIGRLPREVTLQEIKADGRFADLPLVRQPRLSIALVPESAHAPLRSLCGLSKGKGTAQR
jgi:predicted RNA-binding protein with PUA-like domain